MCDSLIYPPTQPPTDSQSEICSIVYYAIIFILRQLKIKKNQRASPNAADPQTQGPRHIPDEPRLRLTGWQEAGARLGGGWGETGRMGGGWEEDGRRLGRSTNCKNEIEDPTRPWAEDMSPNRHSRGICFQRHPDRQILEGICFQRGGNR